MARLAALLGLTLAVVAAAPALASPPDSPHDAAVRALEQAIALRHGEGVRTGRELTPALALLAQRRQHLGTRGRQQANELLARPTGTETSPGHGYTVAEATPDCGTHFCIHYVTSTVDAPSLADTSPANGIPDYVDDMLSAFENEVYPCENTATIDTCGGGTAAGRGWPAPPSDGTLGGNSKFDVYIEDLYPSNVYGYVAPDTNNDFNTDSWHSYLVLDKDFTRYSQTIPGPEEMRVTAAHEYNHVLQYGIDAWEDTWMFESTATYFENVVYPSIDDYLGYLSTWVNATADPLTDANGGGGLKIYGSAVWNHWLDHVCGPAVILDAWQAKDRSQDPSESFAPGSYDSAIQGDCPGKTLDGFADEFEDFSTAVAEWRAPNSGFPDLYPDVAPRSGTLVPNAAGVSESLNHTTFTFLDIPVTSASTLTLSATLPAGLNGAIALVGRTTASTTTGTVSSAITRLPSGGSGSVALPNADTFGRITAVLINADTSNNGLIPNTYDWNFTRDAQQFTGVRVIAGPGVTTNGADGVQETAATLHGSVNPRGKSTTYHFEYGTSQTYGSSTADVSGLTGSTDQPVSASLTNLSPNTTYHFRLVATNADGTAVGGDQSFRTPAAGPPAVATGAPGTVTTTSAIITGTIDAGGKAATATFEYGTSSAYGDQVSVPAGSQFGSVLVSTQLTNLQPGTTYHYRLSGANSDGTAFGDDRTFTTAALPDNNGGGGGTGSKLTLTVAFTKAKLATVLKKGLRVRTHCSSKCNVVLKLVIPAKLAKKLHMKTTLISVKTSRSSVTLHFSKKVAKALSKLKKLSAKLVATAKSSDGRSARVTKVVKLKR